MINKRLHQAMDIRLDEETKALLWGEILRAAEEDTPPEPEEHVMKKQSLSTTLRITLIAAALVCLFTVTASAAGFLGPKAIVIADRTAAAPTDVSESPAALASLTQPQEVPDGLDPAVAAKIENSRAAWADWQAWKHDPANVPQEPEAFRWPEGADSSSWIENDDGTTTITYYDYDKLLSLPPEERDKRVADGSPGELIETRTVSREDMDAWNAYCDYVNTSYGGYDFNYDVHTAQEAAALETIAARYGLSLRRSTTPLWSRETVEASGADIDAGDPRFLTNAELCERVREIGCHGELFTAVPRGFDKVYYFDEGTFCVSFELELPSGEPANCYGYNSVYSTLSSGREVVSQIQDPDAFTVRMHTAPDGTEVTLLQDGGQAFLYVYLDNSFFEESIQGPADMTDEDLDYIADYLIYSNIGR